MLIRVDLPAPFSPTMPVIAPFSIASDTPRTACTLPNDLSIPVELDRRNGHLQELLLM